MINFLEILRRKVVFNSYSVTYLVRVPSAIYQEKILPKFEYMLTPKDYSIAIVVQKLWGILLHGKCMAFLGCIIDTHTDG